MNALRVAPVVRERGPVLEIVIGRAAQSLAERIPDSNSAPTHARALGFSVSAWMTRRLARNTCRAAYWPLSRAIEAHAAAARPGSPTRSARCGPPGRRAAAALAALLRHEAGVRHQLGRPRRRQDIDLGLKRVCARVGLGSDWHPHEQRHTFVSVLSDAGVDIELIADATGHINSTVTREVYRHQITDKVARAAVDMDQVFGTGRA